MQRMGNRAPHAAPQGLYACRGHAPARPSWLALSVETDAQWRALVDVLGRPGWAAAPALAGLAARRERHDDIDVHLRRWFAERDPDAALGELLESGVPAAPVADPRRVSTCPQHAARGFFEEIAHPVTGAHPVPTVPFRLSGIPRWLRRPAPTLGQHTREILGAWIGIDGAELDALERDAVIGTRPLGV